jgi:MraZ protein
MDDLKLSGTFEHTLDPKGRVTLPATYRDYFRDGAVLVRFPGGEPCVNVFHPHAWDKYDEKHYGPLNVRENKAHEWEVRNVYRSMTEVPLDTAGRVLLGRHIDAIGLPTKVTIIGAKDHLEVWDPETLAQRDAEMAASNG